MNNLVKNGIIKEMAFGSNFAYVLNDNSHFLLTEYKVFQSLENHTFLKCMKMIYNGKIQLYYLTNTYITLESVLPNIKVDDFISIVANYVKSVLIAKNNGFLSCQNIEVTPDKIFVELSSLEVSLVYLPLNQRNFSEYSLFVNELKKNLLVIIDESSELECLTSTQLYADLSSNIVSFEELYSNIKDGKTTTVVHSEYYDLKLISLDAPEKVEINITKDEFVIGKNETAVDGVIHFNKAISRMHCKILKRDNHYLIMDLRSANGSYVNKVKLVEYQPYPINDGDIIRLANSSFQVSIKQER